MMNVETTSTLTGVHALLAAVAETSRLPDWEGFSAAEWLEALVLQESGGNPRALRYEPRLDQAGRDDARTDADGAGHDDGDAEDDKSYGLMQVLGTNVRRLCGVPPGTPMRFSFLSQPMLGIGFGVSILAAELQATGGDVGRALARYNGGPTGDQRGPDGRMRCQAYVDAVRARALRVQKAGWWR
jgi:soluble lytic murein transglycosylase-like protein